MRVGVVGAGYVGLVVAACLADAGHELVIVERDADRARAIAAGIVPFHEPGLESLVEKGVADGRLRVVTDPSALGGTEICFVAVGTPSDASARPDLSAVYAAIDALAAVLPRRATVVMKSTVPVGTAAEVRRRLDALKRTDLAVVSNPEFLAEGVALDDFRAPDRVVLGGTDARAMARVAALYAPFVRERGVVLRMDHASAELCKYAANAMLAARLTLMNELANLADHVGADIDAVRVAVGADPRIGAAYLRAGCGFGGSCFPKDLVALEALASDHGEPIEIVPAVRRMNARQQLAAYHRLLRVLGRKDAAGLAVAVWGLAFKPGTDDVREAPALAVIERLLADGATVTAWDHAAGPWAQRHFGDALRVCPQAMDALEGADAVLLMTEWPELAAQSPDDMARRMRGRVVVDGRNLLDPAALVAAGLTWAGIGRGVRS